jgi:hypothetical protein
VVPHKGFVHVDEADELAQDKLDDSCAGLRDMQDPNRDEPAAKLAQQTQSLRKSLSWAAGLLKGQINKETTEMGKSKQNQQFVTANDKGDVWSIDEQWGQMGDAIVLAEEEPQAYGQYEIKSMDDFKVQLRNAHDTLFYQATGLNDFTDEHRLDVNILRELYGEPMATKILQTAEGATGEGDFTTRPEVREMIMYLLYFGIGGKDNSCAKYMRGHLNGRSTPSAHDSALNHFVTGDKVVQTCVFKLEFSHSPNQAEQMGIDFVTETKKQTNIKLSGAGKAVLAKRMYYYMILVLDPEFSAEEIRTAKVFSLSKNSKGRKHRKMVARRKKI